MLLPKQFSPAHWLPETPVTVAQAALQNHWQYTKTHHLSSNKLQNSTFVQITVYTDSDIKLTAGQKSDVIFQAIYAPLLFTAYVLSPNTDITWQHWNYR